MKTILEYVNHNINRYKNFCETFGKITFELDESSLSLLSDNFRQYVTEGCYIAIDDIISEMSQNAQRYDHVKNPKRPNKNGGNRTIWKDKHDNALKIGDHATQREDRPIEKGGDGEHIDEQEIIDMFIYTWNDILDMYNEGQFKRDNICITQCKCYLTGSENNLHADGARPENKFLWAAWMIEENFHTGKLDVKIRTIFRGSYFRHRSSQNKIIIANNGFIKQKKPK